MLYRYMHAILINGEVFVRRRDEITQGNHAVASAALMRGPLLTQETTSPVLFIILAIELCRSKHRAHRAVVSTLRARRQ